jgi:hypothetical protein
MGEHQTAQAAATGSAADQEARQALLLAPAFLVLDTFSFAFVLIHVRHTPREHGATDPPAPHHARAHQEADELTILVAAFLILDAFAFVLSFSGALAEQMGEHQAPQAPASRCSTE